MKKLLSRQEYEEMVKTLPVGSCLFCNKDAQVILDESEHWYWIASLSPYWRYHTMFITKIHKEDVSELSLDEFSDLQLFYLKVKKHTLSLGLLHSDGKPVDQFIFMIRKREEGIPDGSTYPKLKHLHVHFVPDREGVERFVIDSTAVDVDISMLAVR